MGTFATLAVIMLVAVLGPYAASLIPGKSVPEVVFLVFAGAILGPNMLGVIDTTGEAVQAIGELGLAFLFLNAGYEIDVRDLVGPTGKVAVASWAVSLGIGLAMVFSGLAARFQGQAGLAFAIALTTTAYGTLAPIIRDRGLGDTRVGRAIKVYGAYGELLPVLSMSILLSTRRPARAVVVLLIFVGICALVLAFPRVFRRLDARYRAFLQQNAWSGSQPLTRTVVFLLLLLVGVATSFDLDAVLGAFVAGFILRSFVPEENQALDSRLQGISNGFLVPVFFVVSGAGIQLTAAFADLRLLVRFIVLLVLVRGVVVGVSLKVGRETRGMTWREVFSTSAYCTMALPVIVAVTKVAQASGAMDAATASVLVTAGAITVLLVPVVTSFVRVTAEAHPVEAAREIHAGEASLHEVVRHHGHGLLEEERHFLNLRRHGGADVGYSSADYFADEGAQREHAAAADGRATHAAAADGQATHAAAADGPATKRGNE